MGLKSSITRESYSTYTDKKTNSLIQEAELPQQYRILGRNTDGLSQLQALDGSCPTRSIGIHNQPTGAVVLAAFDSSQIGGTGTGSSIFAPGGVWMDHQEPFELIRGVTNAVEYIGFGFTNFLTIEYLLPRELWAEPYVEEVHPGIEVTNLLIESLTTATADVIVGEDAAMGAEGSEGFPVRVRFSEVVT